MKITGKTRITGIFGWPVRHTLSPAMQNAAFEELDFDAVYIPFEIAPARLKEAVSALRNLEIIGVNVTIPHKEKVIPFLDKVDPLAKRIGSVNTIKNNNGKLSGYNTDGLGFLKDVRSKGFNPKGKTAILVGAGGAGKAVAETLSWAGAKKIFVTDKFEAQAKKLAGKVKKASFVPFKKWKNEAKYSDILINATPVGMKKDDPTMIEPVFLKKGLFVYDLVYNRKTRLIQDAKKKGLKAFNGLGMLLNQGTAAFEIWTGRKAPVKIMEKALRAAIGS